MTHNFVGLKKDVDTVLQAHPELQKIQNVDVYYSYKPDGMLIFALDSEEEVQKIYDVGQM